VVASIFGIIEALLSIWEHKEKDKYNAKVKQLKADYYAEINKPDDKRSDAVLDNLLFELRITADALAAQVRIQNA